MNDAHRELRTLLRDIRVLDEKLTESSSKAYTRGDSTMNHSSEEEAALAERAREIVEPHDLPDTKLWANDYNTRTLQQVIAELKSFLEQ
jgi:hypothetical protein